MSERTKRDVASTESGEELEGIMKSLEDPSLGRDGRDVILLQVVGLAHQHEGADVFSSLPEGEYKQQVLAAYRDGAEVACRRAHELPELLKLTRPMPEIALAG